MAQARSGTANAQESLQEILDSCEGSAKNTTLKNLQQYETPEWLSYLCASLLPSVPSVAFDPQSGRGNLLEPFISVFSVDLDLKHASDRVCHLTCSSAKFWEIIDDVWPDLRFECQVANPPFGLNWKTPDGPTDSTEYTWRKMRERTAWNGFGYMIANRKTIERYGWQDDNEVYLYMTLPVGVWKQCDVELGVLFWKQGHERKDRHTIHIDDIEEWSGMTYRQASARATTFPAVTQARRSINTGTFVKRTTSETMFDGVCAAEYDALHPIFAEIAKIMNEERIKRPPFNIYLDYEGMLRTYLSHRFQKRRKLKRDDIIKLDRINDCHPLALTAEKETRMLMKELIESEIYTIQPEAAAAINEALADVDKISAPIMPVTDFEKVAHADEEEALTCATTRFGFKAGKRYPLTTDSYAWSTDFSRNKIHWSEDEGQYTQEHAISLSGMDRYIKIENDAGDAHIYAQHPECDVFEEMKKKQSVTVHSEEEIWDVFEKPIVKTVAETSPEKITRNKMSLELVELMGNFTYYPGQVDFLSRVATKDYGIVAADVGTGKTLMAISLIQMLGPKRALIIAPQGTMRGDSDEDVMEEMTASQWVQELRDKAPGLAVYELFSLEDYERICKLNGGKLPCGVFISYFQAMFQNKGRESVPNKWDDGRLAKDVGVKLPLLGYGDPDYDGDEDIDDIGSLERYVRSVGVERKGIRCIAKPCLSTLIGHEFDMVAVDEAHLCVNLDATITQMLIRLQPKYRFALTATPIPNIVSNLFSLMGWVCVPGWYKGEIRNAAWPWARGEIGRFNSLFLSIEQDHTQQEMNEAKENGSKGKVTKRSAVISSPARLLKHLKPSMAFISKEMCNPDYKEATIIDVRVGLGEQQRALYEFFMDRDRIPGSAYVRAGKQLIYLRNICADPMGFKLKAKELNQYMDEPPEVTSNMNPKTVAILRLVRDIMDRNQQVVILCSRIGQTNTIEQMCVGAGLRVSRIDSTVPAHQHAYQANLFKKKQTDVQLMGIKCAMGYSFPQCPNEIIGSLEYSFGPFHQGKGRVDRVNSFMPANIYCVLHMDTIEESMFDVVATKRDAATICLHGHRVPVDFKPMDISEILANSVQKTLITGTDETECEEQWREIRREWIGGLN